VTHATPTAQPGLIASIAILGRDIKLAHSVFALPFAVLAAVLAMPEGAPRERWIGTLELVIACMVLARTWAMLFNRIADRRFDAENPRTRRRALALGSVPLRRAIVLAALAAVAFVACTSVFGLVYHNWWPLILSVPVLAWIAFYSLTKRFTGLCHLVLGTALAASPLAAAIGVGGLAALNPAAPEGHAAWAILALAGMVVFWVAGFDVIYALADLEFDRQAGLHSIPARLGWRGAAWASRAMHALALAFLVLVPALEPRLGLPFMLGVVAVAGLLVLEHAILARSGPAGLDVAFFTVNGVVSVLLGTIGVLDTLLWVNGS
jgi:4-hydroxybenzoate polyprenyltransferase